MRVSLWLRLGALLEVACMGDGLGHCDTPLAVRCSVEGGWEEEVCCREGQRVCT